MLVGRPSAGLTQETRKNKKKKKKILFGDLGHHEGASYEIM